MGASPYEHSRWDEVLSMLRKLFGLPANSFKAALFRLSGLQPLCHVAGPAIYKLIDGLQEHQQGILEHLHTVAPMSRCAMLFRLHKAMWDDFTVAKRTAKQFMHQVEEKFLASKQPSSRHHQLYKIFGTSRCEWAFLRHKVSSLTLKGCCRFMGQ